jgi:PAS domain S-box-containing protein
MNDREKTRAELLEEIAALRAKVTALEAACEDQTRLGAESQRRDAYYRLDAVNDTLFLMKPDGTMTLVNEGLAHSFGKTVDELIGTNSYDLVPEPVADQRREFVKQVLESGEALVIEDQRYGRHIENRIYPLKDGRGTITHLAVFGWRITERKQAENALRAFEARFSTIFHASPIPIALTRLRDHQLVDVNKAWITLTGYSHGEAAGNSPPGLNLYADPDDRTRLVNQLRREGRVENFEFRLRKKSGELAVLLLSAELIDLEGEPHMLSMAMDVTVRNQAQDALRESEEKFRSIFAESPISIELYDSDGKLLDANAACLKIFGVVKRDELTGFRLFDHDVIPRDALQQLSSGEAIQFEIQRDFAQVRDLKLYETTKTGQFWLHTVLSPLGWNEQTGTAQGYIAQTQDVTERKQAEQSLRESKAMLEAAFHNMQYAINVGHNGIQVMTNAAAATLFGYDSSDEFVGMPIVAFIVSAERPRIADYARRRSAGLPAPTHYETRGLCKDGSEFDVDVFVSTYEIDKEVYTLAAIRDVTEEKRLQQAEREQRELAEALAEIGLAISTTYELQSLSEVILDQVARVVEYDAAGFTHIDGNLIRPLVMRGFEREFTVQAMRDGLPMDQMQLVRQAVQNKRGVFLTWTPEDKNTIPIPGFPEPHSRIA